jgi:hypothetical protein
MTSHSKKKRQFNTVESSFLNEMMQQAVNIVHNLDELSDQSGCNVEELPHPCVIRPDLAYDLCSAVTHMYEKLVEQELVSTGNKTNQYILH